MTKSIEQTDKKRISEDIIIHRIYTIRGYRVMIDRDLAVLYQVNTRVLNQAVRRNIQRFPDDFMFQMNKQEFENWISQIVTSNSLNIMGIRKRPLAFTEQGIAMLSSVLHSEFAIQINISIIRVFTKVRRLLESHQEILQRLINLENKNAKQEEKIMLILDYLRSFEEMKKREEAMKNRRKIGYKVPEGD